MTLFLTSIAARSRRAKADPADTLTDTYIARSAHYSPCTPQTFESESALLLWLDQLAGRTPAQLILLDSRGKQLSSEQFAAQLAKLRDSGVQSLVFAIGPADGWSPATRSRANLILSFGPITLPHQLARVVLAEQVYRAFTILAGHPYHSGH